MLDQLLNDFLFADLQLPQKVEKNQVLRRSIETVSRAHVNSTVWEKTKHIDHYPHWSCIDNPIKLMFTELLAIDEMFRLRKCDFFFLCLKNWFWVASDSVE